MPPRVFTVTGPSGSGKSELVNVLLGMESDEFRPVLIGKFTTRRARKNDGPEVICVDEIPTNCDIAYEQYGVRYGFRSQDLWNHVASGRSPIVILNDVRTVEDVKAQFSDMAQAIYVFRDAPSYERLLALSKQRGVESASPIDGDEYTKRYMKAIMIHRIYIENVHLFDWVILNVGDGLMRMVAQVEPLVHGTTATHRRFV